MGALCVKCATPNEDHSKLLVPFICPWEEVETLGKLIVVVKLYLHNYCFLLLKNQRMQHQRMQHQRMQHQQGTSCRDV